MPYSFKILTLAIPFLLIFHNPVSAQSGAEVIEFTTICTVSSGKLTVARNATLQINSREGEAYNKVRIYFNKRDKVNNIEASLTTATGALIRKLKKSDITEVSAVSDIALYEDDFVKRFELKHNTYPYRISYSFSITYPEFIHIAHWYPSLYGLPSKNASLILEVPKDYKFNLESKYLNDPIVTEKEDSREYKWSATFNQVLHDEIYAPDWQELIPHLSIAPQKFTYGIGGSLDSWTSFGNWIYQLNDGLGELPEEEKKTLSSLVEGVEDPREKVRRIYHYLQDHTRYILVSLDIGGLKSYPASYVAQNKYGDCKALSNYMKSALAFAGIESFYTIMQVASPKE